MSRRSWLSLLIFSCAIPFGSSGSSAEPADWPRFRGPGGDGVCTETGLNWDWPPEGPKLLWKVEGIGKGYSSVSIAGGRIYTMGDRSDGGDESQFVIALDGDTREEIWAAKVGPPHSDGPRCTPTVAAGLVYALGTDGDLVCLDAASGGLRWKKNLADDFGGKMMSVWKFSESPIVDGPRLVCTPGGPEALIVALDKTTGDLIWKCALPRSARGAETAPDTRPSSRPTSRAYGSI